MVCETGSRTDRIFHYLPAYEPVLWDHRIGWLGIVLYLAGTAGVAAVVDVSGAKTVGDK